MEITSVREYSDRSESIKHIKILDDYDIRNFDSYFTCTVSNNGSVCSFTERKLFKAFNPLFKYLIQFMLTFSQFSNLSVSELSKITICTATMLDVTLVN